MSKPPAEEIPARSVILKEVLVSFLPLFSLIILVLGTILGGLATPAEAAVGAFGALVLSYFYKTLKWKNFKESIISYSKNNRNDYVVVHRIMDFCICISLT